MFIDTFHEHGKSVTNIAMPSIVRKCYGFTHFVVIVSNHILRFFAYGKYVGFQSLMYSLSYPPRLHVKPNDSDVIKLQRMTMVFGWHGKYGE